MGNVDKVDIDDIVCSSSFLSGFGFLIENGISVQHKKGCFLYDYIDSAPYIGMVVTGEVAVSMHSTNGNETQLSSLKPGDCFGVSNLLGEYRMMTTLRCRCTTEVIYISKDFIITSMKTNPELAMRYAMHCNDKINFLLRRLEALTLQTTSEKLAKYLLQHGAETRLVTISTSREKFASYLGISRAALYRDLSRLENLGAIEMCGKKIEIKDTDILKEITGR